MPRDVELPQGVAKSVLEFLRAHFIEFDPESRRLEFTDAAAFNLYVLIDSAIREAEQSEEKQS